MATKDNIISGVLIMNKPQDFTSHDVVAKLRGILRTKKIGHGGTLDPMATGVLPVFIGGATKGADYAAAQDKEYIAGFTLGMCTDTQDTTGTTIETSDTTAEIDTVRQAIASFLGEQKQLPPMYSAVQINGQRLYDLARKGVTVERPTRDIFISEIELLEFDDKEQKGKLRVIASKGTYVRTIVHDLGEKLGTFAAMNSLVRTRAGNYDIKDAVDFATVEKMRDEDKLCEIVMPTDTLFVEYPRVDIDDYGLERANKGAFISPKNAKNMPMTKDVLCRVYHNDVFLLLAKVDELKIGGLALFLYKNFR